MPRGQYDRTKFKRQEPAVAETEVETLGPKEPGKLYKPKAVTNVKPAPGAPVVSKPGLNLKAPSELLAEKLFPVKLFRNYVPRTNHFQIGHAVTLENGDEEVTWEDPDLPDESDESVDTGFANKLPKDTYAMLPVSEAKELFRNGIAERADSID